MQAKFMEISSHYEAAMSGLMMMKFESIIKILVHNIILHPIAGLFWAAGFQELAFKVHDLVLPLELE